MGQGCWESGGLGLGGAGNPPDLIKETLVGILSLDEDGFRKDKDLLPSLSFIHPSIHR